MISITEIISCIRIYLKLSTSNYTINDRDVLLQKTEIRETSIKMETALNEILNNKNESFEEFLGRIKSDAIYGRK